MLHGAVLGIGVARRATEGVAQLGDEVGITIHRQRVRLCFAIGVVAEGAEALSHRAVGMGIEVISLRHLHKLAEVVVGIVALVLLRISWLRKAVC